jgi:hypothetical protein
VQKHIVAFLQKLEAGEEAEGEAAAAPPTPEAAST